MRRFLDLLNLVLLAGIVGFALWAWPRLPAEIPVHFGPDGRPDRWSGTTPGSWFFLPGLAVVLHGGGLALRRWMAAAPHRINLPGGRTAADYAPGVRERVVEHLRLFLALVALEVLVIFGLIQVGTWRTALGAAGEGPLLAVLALSVLSGPVLMVVFFLGLQRVTRPGAP